jgi:hypothetical protein
MAMAYGVLAPEGAGDRRLGQESESSLATLLRGLLDISWMPTAPSEGEERGGGREPERPRLALAPAWAPDLLVSKPLADCTKDELFAATELAMVADTPARFLEDLLETSIIGLLDAAGAEALRELPDPDGVLRRLVEERAAEHDLSSEVALEITRRALGWPESPGRPIR